MNLGLSISPMEPSTCALEEPGIKPPIFQLVDDRSTSSAQLPKIKVIPGKPKHFVKARKRLRLLLDSKKGNGDTGTIIFNKTVEVNLCRLQNVLHKL